MMQTVKILLNMHLNHNINEFSALNSTFRSPHKDFKIKKLNQKIKNICLKYGMVVYKT